MFDTVYSPTPIRLMLWFLTHLCRRHDLFLLPSVPPEDYQDCLTFKSLMVVSESFSPQGWLPLPRLLSRILNFPVNFRTYSHLVNPDPIPSDAVIPKDFKSLFLSRSITPPRHLLVQRVNCIVFTTFISFILQITTSSVLLYLSNFITSPPMYFSDVKIIQRLCCSLLWGIYTSIVQVGPSTGLELVVFEERFACPFS